MSDLEEILSKGLGAFDRDSSGTDVRLDRSSAVGERKDISNRRFELLMHEYARATDFQNKQFDQVLRVAAIGFSAAGALFFLVVNKTLPFGEWVLWVAPLLLTLLYSIAIFLTYSMVFTGYYTRELEDDLAKLSGIEYFHYSNAFARGMTSFRTGYPQMLASTILFLVFAASIYLAMVIIGLVQLRRLDVPVWRQIAFLLVHGVLTITLVWSAMGIWTNLRSTYDCWRTESAAKSRIQRDKAATTRLIVFDVLSYAILPRPFDFVLKSLFTIGALVITALILDIPFTFKLLTIGFLTVLCVDYLAKQATYIWNEILDAPLDRAHPYKSKRLLSRIDNPRIGKLLFLKRAGAAVVLSLIIATEYDLWWLPPTVGIIFIWQWCYDRWAKRGPIRRLVLASTGYAQRAAAGSLAAMSSASIGVKEVASTTALSSVSDPLLVFALSGWMVVCMFMVLAEFWWAERKDMWEKVHGSGSSERAPSRIWFLSSAPRIEAIANITLVAVGLLLALVYGDSSSTRPSTVTAWLSNARRRLDREFGSHPREALATLGNMREFEMLGHGTSAGYVTFWMVTLFLAGSGLVLVIRSNVTSSNRNRWSNGVALALILSIALFPGSWLGVLAFGLPLLLAANFRNLSLKEMQVFFEFLKVLPVLVLDKLDLLLFQPWAVRISIRPAVAENATPETRREAEAWAEALQYMYFLWGKQNNLTPKERTGDGGGTYDLLLSGQARQWTRLPTEAGFHELILESSTSGARHISQVIIQPLGVDPKPSMGSGVDVPFDPVPRAVSGEVGSTALQWRQYVCCADRGSFICRDAIEPRTGTHIDAPERVLHDGPSTLRPDERS